MKKTLSLIFTVLFLAVCLVPGLGLLLTGGADAAANEILPAAPVIAADGDFNPDFLAETADYVNGRFSFRLEGITAWAKLNAALFRTSTAENVLLGRDGWLFYAPTIHDYTGDAPMTARELYCAARTLYLLQEYAENRGGDFLFTAAPNKNTLYPEYMPARTRLGSVSDMDALYALLGDMGVSYLDLRDIFSQEDEPLYFKTDSHWNAKGAALAADALLAALSRESNYFSGTVSAGNTHRGDLYEMLYPAGKELEEDFTYAPGFSFTANTDNPDRVTITTESGRRASLLPRFVRAQSLPVSRRELRLGGVFPPERVHRRDASGRRYARDRARRAQSPLSRGVRFARPRTGAGRLARRDGCPGRWESRFDGERRYGRVHALFRHMGRRDAGRCVQRLCPLRRRAL